METFDPSKVKAFKKAFQDLFGKTANSSEKITDRVKTFEDALELVDVDDELELLSYRGRNKNIIAAKAFLKLTIIIKALNEGWTPDWTDSSQNKYYCWFKANASGVGLSYIGYGCAYTNTNVGSRLVFRSAELATFAGKQFEGIYNEYLSL